MPLILSAYLGIADAAVELARTGVLVHAVAPGFVATRMAVVDGNDAKMFGLGYVYNLSKRTSLYANYANINNGDRTKAFIVSTPPATTAMANGEKSTGYELGIRHDF